MCLTKNLLKYEIKNITSVIWLPFSVDPVVDSSTEETYKPPPHANCTFNGGAHQIQIVHFSLRSSGIQSNGPNQQVFCGGQPLTYLGAVMNHHGPPEAPPPSQPSQLHPHRTRAPQFKHPRLTASPLISHYAGPTFSRPRGDPPQSVVVKF